MKEKDLSQKVEEEWESFVSSNKIVRKKLDPTKNVFQEPKTLPTRNYKIFSPNLEKNIETDNKKPSFKGNNKIGEASLFKEVEKNKLKKIKQGKISPERTVDLHGLTLLKAEVELRRVIELCIRDNKRFLLVITGKGRHSGEEKRTERKIIKTVLPQWINKKFYLDKVQYFSFATQKHGGTGAYYLFLKRL
jgi:DNA-nicking Smr family endonuclease